MKTSSSYTEESDELTEKSSFGYYIPFEKSLSKLIVNLSKNTNLYEFNENNINELKTDFFNGKFVQEIFKNRDFVASDFLSILIYTDEIELTNAIGSSRTKHKLSK